MLTDDDFRELIETFLVTTNMTPTALGVGAMRDPGFVPAVRNGRSPTLRVVERVVNYMRAWEANAGARQL